MEKQDKLRKELKRFINSVSGLAIKADIDPTYLHRWYNGMKVGKETEKKIEALIKSL